MISVEINSIGANFPLFPGTVPFCLAMSLVPGWPPKILLLSLALIWSLTWFNLPQSAMLLQLELFTKADFASVIFLAIWLLVLVWYVWNWINSSKKPKRMSLWYKVGARVQRNINKFEGYNSCFTYLVNNSGSLFYTCICKMWCGCQLDTLPIAGAVILELVLSLTISMAPLVWAWRDLFYCYRVKQKYYSGGI